MVKQFHQMIVFYSMKLLVMIFHKFIDKKIENLLM